MRLRLPFLVAVVALTGCGGASISVPPTSGVPLAQSGALVFPANSGFGATAHYTLSSAPNGVSIVLQSQSGNAGLPNPHGLALGPNLVSFTFTVDKPVTLAQLPTLQITAPPQTVADELSVQFCPDSFCTYSAGPDTVSGQMILYDFSLGIVGGSPTLSLSPGIVYAFEVLGPYDAPSGSLPP